MYQAKITEKEAGQRFDKYLHRILPNAGSSFLYKMLRKKNITLNDKKADGSEKIVVGDSVAIYFSNETLDKFMGVSAASGGNAYHEHETQGQASKTGYEREDVTGQANTRGADYLTAYHRLAAVQILYENDHILLADKPAGVLSQKAQKDDITLNEWLIGYLLDSGAVTAAELTAYKPSVCNRLDRNTSGIVLCAKSLRGAQMLGGLLKDRTLHKYYQAYVRGHVSEEQLIEGYLTKDETSNKVSVSEAHGAYIKTAYRPLQIERDKTLLEVELITGKSHQIRAHLAGIGHPLLGDYKYGDKAWNDIYQKKYHVRSQLLHAYKVVFPQLEEPFADISGQTFCAELPEIFKRVAEEQEFNII